MNTFIFFDDHIVRIFRTFDAKFTYVLSRMKFKPAIKIVNEDMEAEKTLKPREAKHKLDPIPLIQINLRGILFLLMLNGMLSIAIFWIEATT